MNRTKTISRILAGVSAVALTATIGTSLARAGSVYDGGPYASITQLLSTDFIVIDALVNGDVTIPLYEDGTAIELQVGPDEDAPVAVAVLDGSVVNGALHNDGLVYATDDDLAIGIEVEGGALLHDGIENDGEVRAWASGSKGGEVDAVGIAYDVDYGQHSHSWIDNSGEIHARTRLTGEDASAGSVGVAQDVSGTIAEADLDNDGWISSLADASSSDIYDEHMYAEATAAGVIQDVYSEDLSAIADVDNTGTIDSTASGSATSFLGDAHATALVAGVNQEVTSGFDGSAEVDNALGAMIDVNGQATASAGNSYELNGDMGDGSAFAAAGGAGIFQFVHGQFTEDQADTSAADIRNAGAVAVSLSATADAYGSDVAAYATAGGAGALQVVFSADGEGNSSHADVYNEGTIGLGVHADAFAAGADVSAQALALGIGQAQGVLSIGGEGHADIHNDHEITADIDAVATADIATAFALGAGSLQAAVGTVAYATLTNDGLLQADIDVDASGEYVGAAIGVGMGAAQLSLALGGSDALINNTGTIDLDVTADASSRGLATANALALGGALQVAGSLLGEAHASLSNTSLDSIDVLGEADAYGEAAHADSYVIGAGQVAVSLERARADLNNTGAIDAKADSSAEGSLGWAEADVSAVDQLLLAVGDAYASIANAEGATIHAEADAVAEGFVGVAVAGAAGINQYGASQELHLDIYNHGSITADAYASGFGPLMVPLQGEPEPMIGGIAEARAVIQSPLSRAGDVMLENKGLIRAVATAEGTSGAGAIAEGHVIRPPTDVIEAALETAGSLLGGGLGGGMIGPGEGGLGAPGLPLIMGAFPLEGEDLAGLGDLIGGAGGFDASDLMAGISADFGDMTEFAMNVKIDVRNSGRIEASANAASGARGVGAWYQGGGIITVDPDPLDVYDTVVDVTIPGALAGSVTNSGLISGSAIASDLYGSAEAFGVVEVSAGENTTSLTNTGTIRAYAEGAVPSATGIAVASFGSAIEMGPNNVEPPDVDPVTTITNSGGLIWAAIKTTSTPPDETPELVDVRRGNAINTRGNITNIRTYVDDFDAMSMKGEGFSPVNIEVDDLLAAPNQVVVNLEGGIATDGKAHMLAAHKAGVLSEEMKSAFGGESSVGFVYGDIQLTEDDVINVTQGVTLFDGVINNPDKPEPVEVGFSDSHRLSELNINNNGTLVMLQNKNEGASRGYVHDLHIGNNGEEGEDYAETEGTLVYELTSNNVNDPTAATAAGKWAYSQIFTDEADIRNGKFHAVFQAGLYDDVTVYQNIIDADELVGEFKSVTDNSLLLNTRAAYEDGDGTNEGQNVDLVVERTAFNAVGGQTHNQRAVGGAIEKVYKDGIEPGSNFDKLVSSMFTVGSEEDYANFLDQLSGAEYAQQLQSVLWSTRGLNSVITERMECTDGSMGGSTQTSSAKVGDNTVMPTADAPMQSTGCFEPGQASVWMRGTGQWTSLSGDDEAPGLDETQYGILFGADYSFDENWFAGIAGGYFNSNGDFEDWGGRSGGSSEYDGLQIAAYGGYDNSTYYLRGVLAYGNYDGEVDRSIDTTDLVQGHGTSGHLSGDPSSDVFSFYGETGYRFAVGGAGNVTPFAGLSLASATLDGFTESDSGDTGAALDVEDSDADSLASVLGLRLDADMAMSSGVFTPSVSVAWMHEFGDTEQTVDASFADAPGSDFSVVGSEVARDSVLVDAGANFSMDDTFDLGLFYSGQFNENYSANSVSARLGYKF